MKKEFKQILIYSPKQRNFLLVLLLSLSFIMLIGQNSKTDFTTTQQIWIDFNPNFKLNKKFSIYSDIAVRKVFPNEWYRFIIGPSVRYTLSKPIFKDIHQRNEFHAGIRFFSTIFTDKINTFEIRFFQGYKFFVPLGKRFDFRNYLRLEERLIFNTNSLENKIAFRFRILPTLTYKFNDDILKRNKGSYLFANAEFFIDMIDTIQFSDLIRLNTGIGKYFNNGLRAEFVLGFFIAKQTLDSNFQTNEFIYRFRFFHTILDKNNKKKESLSYLF